MDVRLEQLLDGAGIVPERGGFTHATDLTGLWSGEYSYGGAPQPTPFTAHIIDTGGSITGTTLEPATFGMPGLSELSACINGARGELTVRFTKLYDPAPGVHRHPIFYTGAIDPNFTMIDGQWTFANGFSGRFVLVRASRGAKAEAKSREAAVAGKRQAVLRQKPGKGLYSPAWTRSSNRRRNRRQAPTRRR